MADSDDDMPPPLDDMTQHVTKLQQQRDERIKTHLGGAQVQEQVEETRLKPNTVIKQTEEVKNTDVTP
jgi:hypothetical protein